MPAIFQGCPGKVVAVKIPVTDCQIAMVSVKDEDNSERLTYERDTVVLTRITVNQSANVQFLHTIGNRIYVYAFGDRMGQITLSGLAFGASCDNPLTAHSTKNVLDWYRLNKVSTRATPVSITIFDVAFQAFVLALNTDVVDASSKLVQWTLTLATLPD